MTNGYALRVPVTNKAFGWYSTRSEAELELDFQFRVYMTRLELVRPDQAIWPD